MPKLPKTKKPEVVAEPKSNGREVLYPEVSVELCVGENAMTAEHARKLIGWVDENVQTPDCYDLHGKKVRLANNTGNRPFDKGLAMMWMSEILHRRWKVNGETLIIGRTGVTISAQHRCAGLIWAVQEWHRSKDNWPQWETEPTLPCIIVFGIDEDDATVNTIDTGKPRGIDDVIYRSELFKGKEPKERLKAAKATKNAVKLLCHRVGANDNALVKSRRTHAESLDFIARHPKLITCVNHITEEDEGGKIAKYLTPGYSAAFMYLMGAATSDPANYRKKGIEPCEDFLNWQLWDKAETFWTELAQGHKKFKALQEALAQLFNSDDVYPATRQALVIKAWNAYCQDEPITDKVLELRFKVDDEAASKKLLDKPTIGGIDLGEPGDHEQADEEEDDGDPTPDQIAERAAAIRSENGKKNGKKSKVIERNKAVFALVGQRVWIAEDGGHVTGTVSEIYSIQSGQVAKVKMGKKEFEFPIEACLTADPNS